MLILDRRVQILLDERRYRRVAAAARARKVSVAEVIREAIDLVLPQDHDARKQAADAILGAEPMPVPETVEELKRELRRARERGR